MTQDVTVVAFSDAGYKYSPHKEELLTKIDRFYEVVPVMLSFILCGGYVVLIDALRAARDAQCHETGRSQLTCNPSSNPTPACFHCPDFSGHHLATLVKSTSGISNFLLILSHLGPLKEPNFDHQIIPANRSHTAFVSPKSHGITPLFAASKVHPVWL